MSAKNFMNEKAYQTAGTHILVSVPGGSGHRIPFFIKTPSTKDKNK